MTVISRRIIVPAQGKAEAALANAASALPWAGTMIRREMTVMTSSFAW